MKALAFAGLAGLAIWAALNVGVLAARHEWPSLRDREVWTPEKIERRSAADMDRRAAPPFYNYPPPTGMFYATSNVVNGIVFGGGRHRGVISTETLTNDTDD